MISQHTILNKNIKHTIFNIKYKKYDGIPFGEQRKAKLQTGAHLAHFIFDSTVS